MDFTFIETQVFTARIVALSAEEALRRLQQELMQNPALGPVVPRTGGLRKVRMADAARGKGKRGGLRVHYVWLERASRFYLLFVYGKDEQDDLTAAQEKALRQVVEAIKRETRL